MANRERNVTKPVGFRPTAIQRQRLELIAAALGNPGRLAVAIRWMIENTPVPAKQVEANNVRGKQA